MDLPGKGSPERGTLAYQARCFPDMDDNQLWWLDEQKPGSYYIRNFAAFDYCLLAFDSDDSDKRLRIWPCDPKHAWQLVNEP
ncbi:RICIN domain-containing protein [Streptomyces sp. SM14]|uniref:RICIN domain-containing protein n=1 Tax=Streptomyces sp. SM14 TaxID=1736045 RepID=UPI0035BBC30A